MTIVGATVTPLLALAPASSRVPSWSIYLCATIGTVGFYVMVAPLLRLWPWSEATRPHLLALSALVILIAVFIVVVHGGGAHTALGHSSTRPPKRKTLPPGSQRVALKNAVAYRGKYFTVQIPSGWSIEEDEVDKSGEKESTWKNLAEPRDTLLIDFSPATDLSLEQDAASVHEMVLHEEGSRELYYGVGDLSNVKSWVWIFRRPQNERIDYFFNRCSTGFAVLGRTPSNRFTRMRPIFRAVAESVEANCDR